jgi:hypothetical protein
VHDDNVIAAKNIEITSLNRKVNGREAMEKGLSDFKRPVRIGVV